MPEFTRIIAIGIPRFGGVYGMEVGLPDFCMQSLILQDELI